MRRVPLPPGTLPVLVLMTLGLVIGAVGFAVGRARAAGDSEGRRRTAVVRAIEHAAPAVVSVFADSKMRRGYLRRGAGSGVVVHPGGYVVTNAHVIEGGQRIHVQLFKESRSLEAAVVVSWPERDLALLKIQAQGRRFPYVSLCPSRKVMLGETAIAVGNPRGLGDTITVGVVSAVGRDAKMNSGAELRGLIQTDASINTGNSGGALLNLDGELIGIIVSLLPRASGIAFAIPCDQVDTLVQRGIRTRAPKNPLPADATTSPSHPSAPTFSPVASHGSPGANAAPDPVIRTPKTRPLCAADFGLHIRDTGSELQVLRVDAGSRAEETRLRAGDVLLAVDGSPVEDQTDLLMAFSRSTPGQEYAIEVRRRGSRETHVLAAPR